MGVTEIPRHPYRALAVLGYSCVGFALAQTMLFPALPALIAGLQTDANDVAWTITAFFLSAAVATPVLGRLGDMFGKRRMLVVSMTAYTVGTLVSAVSVGLWLVVGGRVVAGLGGAVFPLSLSMARELVPPALVGRVIGFLAATLLGGSAVGLVLGGAIVDNLSWRWIFGVAAAMGAVAAVGLRALTPESSIKSGGRVDIRGAIVLGVGLVLPLFAISRAAVWGWIDPRTLALIGAGLVVLAGWVLLELRTEQPLADIASLRSAPVLLTNLATIPVGFVVSATVVLVALMAQAPTSTGYGFGLGATGAGLILLPGGLLSVLSGPASGALGARVGDKFPLALGGLLGASALGLLALDHGTVAEVATFAALAQGGAGMAIAALPNLIVGAVPQGITGESLSFNALVTRVGNSVGVQLPATIVAASAVAGTRLPTNAGFTTAVAVAAAISLVGSVTALLIPRIARRDGRRAHEQAGSVAYAPGP